MYDSRNIIVPRQLTKNSILEYVSESYIMRHYLGFDFELNKAYKSPLRDESNPSFALYITASGELRFKDFNGAQGSCFDLVMHLHNVDFVSALQIIDRDLNLSIASKPAKFVTVEQKVYKSFKNDYSPKSQIQCKPQRFTKQDKDYWATYGITEQTLLKYEVYSARYIFLNKKLLLQSFTNNPVYCYRFPSGNLKVYRPFAHKGAIKWLSNVEKDDVQGLKQLDRTKDILIITKSLKDVMCLHGLGYSSIAPQSEGTRTQYPIIKQECNNFNKVFILFDNDDAGRNGANTLKDYLDINAKCIFIQESKDISDLIAEYGIEKAEQFLIKECNEK